MSYNGSQWLMNNGYPENIYLVHFSYEKDGEFLANRGYIRPYFSKKAARSAASWHRGTVKKGEGWGSIKPATRIFGIEGIAEEMD